MECGICCKHFGSSRKPTCISCARSAIYEPRIEQVTGFIEKEEAHNQVRDISSDNNPETVRAFSGQSVDLAEAARKLETEALRSRIESIELKSQSIREHSQTLRRQIQDACEENEFRKKDNLNKRRRICSTITDFRGQKGQVTGPLEEENLRSRRKLEKTHETSESGRVQLCREVARLAGLTLRRRKSRDGSITDEYMICGQVIPDLRTLNTVRPEVLNAVLLGLTQLLATCCHYLSVRLPAELMIARPDLPHPAMLSLQSSYQNHDLTPQNMTSSVFRSPASSRTLTDTSKRPKLRHLHIEKPLPRLAKEDPQVYDRFVEGAVLFAWDIAWLCRTQGVSDIDTWQDVCAIGPNMWRLLMKDEHSNSCFRQNPEPIDGLRSSSAFYTPRFGELSHGSSVDNLCGRQGTELMRTWRLQSVAHMVDKIKSHLLTEMSGAEWELLDEKEWNKERDDEQAVLVGGARPSESKMGVSFVTAVGGDDDDGGRGRDKSASGYVKVRDRPGDQ